MNTETLRQSRPDVQNNSSTVIFIYFEKAGNVYRRFGSRFCMEKIQNEISFQVDLPEEFTREVLHRFLVEESMFQHYSDQELFGAVLRYLCSLDSFKDGFVNATQEDSGLLITINADDESSTSIEKANIRLLLNDFNFLNDPFDHNNSSVNVYENYKKVTHGSRIIDEMSDQNIIQYLRIKRGLHLLLNLDRDYYRQVLNQTFTDEEWFDFIHFTDKCYDEENGIWVEFFLEKWEKEKKENGYQY